MGCGRPSGDIAVGFHMFDIFVVFGASQHVAGDLPQLVRGGNGELLAMQPSDTCGDMSLTVEMKNVAILQKHFWNDKLLIFTLDLDFSLSCCVLTWCWLFSVVSWIGC